MKPRAAAHRSAAPQRGVATLAVVMVLFFIVSLMAAYTSRNLIFEQRTSANQYRGTMAFEAADAGIDWTLALLNGGVIGDDCGAGGSKSFAQRYLAISAGGLVTHPARGGNWPTCVFNGTDWSECRCPDDAALDPSSPGGTGPFPAFRAFIAPPGPTGMPATPENQLLGRSGLVWLQTTGCTRLAVAAGDTCLDYLPQGDVGEGVARVFTLLALRSGLAVPPSAPVTARLSVEPAAGVPPLRVINTDAQSGGLTVMSGAPTLDTSRFQAQTLAGTPGELSLLADDQRLKALSNTAPPTAPPAPPALTAGERMFAATFGMKRETYREQPGLRLCASPCSTAAINTLLSEHPDRVIWVDGDLTLDATPVGTPAAPVLLVMDGATLTLDPGAQVHGFVYLTGGGAAESVVALGAGAARIDGALVAEGGLRTTAVSSASDLTVAYDAAALNLLRTRYGSWVKVPGSWRDFRE